MWIINNNIEYDRSVNFNVILINYVKILVIECNK